MGHDIIYQIENVSIPYKENQDIRNGFAVVKVLKLVIKITKFAIRYTYLIGHLKCSAIKVSDLANLLYRCIGLHLYEGIIYRESILMYKIG